MESKQAKSLTSAQKSVPEVRATGQKEFPGFDFVDQHSSEEELECINGSVSQPTSRSSSVCGEKRKFSRASSASSEDEEVKSDARRVPLEFHSKPPANVYRPQSFTFVTDDSDNAELISANESASPRKRHRHLHRIPRPCLDFEKMQQKKARNVTTWRHGGELTLPCY
ncbi:unnamed protein product [Notodromas monacha]|uniref:Uncharacterized protein n=1 Tax=Notodromas monacha TaxID=399045 RepID=A0A7R9BLN8_9CRUS|nr:unnamed protein product [Notodromas monacha]CAG0916706.1 unnamed protein product [Notodromas monacha]